MVEPDRTRWHPIADYEDLPFRHVFHGQLLGRELAVWRADDGYVNIWENRCLHRGVRLSIGINDGRELKCQYHGWRYANRTAGCTYIPAHPANAPARTITSRKFACIERYGLIWTAEDPVGEVPQLAGLTNTRLLTLRGVSVNAPADRIRKHLETYCFQPHGDLEGTVAAIEFIGGDDYAVELVSSNEEHVTYAAFFIQPVDADRSVIRGVVTRPTGDARGELPILRHHNTRLTWLRGSIESETAAMPARPSLEPVIDPLPTEVSILLDEGGRRDKTNRVVVIRKWLTAVDIIAFELKPVSGLLPTALPGAHVDVHLPNGLIRQYSLVNGPGETGSYIIGVKREDSSNGGSLCLHETIRLGDVLAISEPRNTFPLRRDALKTILVAGGIGVTPLIAMAQVLQHQKLAFELHYFARSADHIAFPERMQLLGNAFKPHLGLDNDATRVEIETTLGNFTAGTQLYICGPAPMVDTGRAAAVSADYPEEAIHFEYFKNTRKLDRGSHFQVALARSCVTIDVPSGKSILEAIREAGLDMPSSCEQGACGTCVATVIEGEPDHQDVYLSAAEHRAGTKILTCVSRSKSERLVLDL